MKRIVLWLMTSVTALVLLFGYHTSTSSSVSSETSVVAPVQGSLGTASSCTPDATAAASAASCTVTGDAASTRWGPVQVQLSISNTTIATVTVVQYPNSNGRDQEINARALPILIQETVDAQSPQIDMVSGATVTSDGYVESLQSALDKAGL